MSSTQSTIPRLAKKQENSFHMEIIQLIETEMSQLLDLKYKDMSAVIMKKFQGLMENLDLMVEEIRESLKNDLKEILGVKSTPEMKNPKNSSTREGWEQIKGTTSIETGLIEKIEEDSVEDIEKLTFKRKEVIKPNSKFDNAKDCSTNQGEESSQNESQSHKIVEGVEETTCNIDDTGGNRKISIEVTGEGQEHGEDVLIKEMREESTPQNFKNKEKILKASKDEGAMLTLAADFSSATLDICKQWSNVFNILRESDFEPKLLCQVKLSLKYGGEIVTFSDMQSFRKFISQKSCMKELLKDTLSETEKIKKGGKRYGIQEKLDKTLIASKHGAGGATSDGLSFLFIKEVKVIEPEEVKNVEAHVEEALEWTEKALKEEEAFELEEKEKETLELEGEEEETSELEQETSELEEEENSELEEEETLELEEKEQASVLCKEQHSTFQHYTMVNRKHGNEITSDLENILTKELEDSQEEEDSEWELEVFFTWEEGKDSKVEKIKNTFQSEKQEVSPGPKEIACSYLASDSEKNLLVKHELTSKETELMQETEENFRRSVINCFREIQEKIGNVKELPVWEIKSSAALGSRIDTLEERINNLEDRIENFSKDTMQMAKQIIIKERIRDLEDRSKISNIRLIGIPEKDNKGNGAEEIVKEIIEENFAELMEDSGLDIVSAFRIPSKIDEKRLTPRHILVKFRNYSDKEKIITASRDKEVTYRGTRIRLTSDLSLNTLDARSQWGSIIRVLQAKGFKPRILYPAKLAFDFEGKTKIFFDIIEFRKFISCIPSLKESLENVF